MCTAFDTNKNRPLQTLVALNRQVEQWREDYWKGLSRGDQVHWQNEFAKHNGNLGQRQYFPDSMAIYNSATDILTILERFVGLPQPIDFNDLEDAGPNVYLKEVKITFNPRTNKVVSAKKSIRGLCNGRVYVYDDTLFPHVSKMLPVLTLYFTVGLTSSPDWMSLPLLENDRFAAFSLKFSADDSEVIAGGNEHSIFIFKRELNKTVLRLNGHDDDVNAVAFADSFSHLILSGGDDGLCKVWDRRILADATHTPEPVGVFAGHRDGLTFIDPRGDDRYILTNSKDQTIKLWDLRHFSSIEGQKATKQAVSRQGWDYRWQSPEIVRSPLPGDASIMTFRGSHSVLHTLLRARFSPDHTGKRFIYASCAKGNVVVYDMFSGEVCTILEGHKSVVRDCHWHPQYNEIISSSWDGQTALWKFDERAVRDTNPDSDVENIGCEDSSDEFYRPISKDDKRPKRKPRPRFNPYNLDRPDLIDEQYDDEDKPRTTRSMAVQQPTRAATTSRVTAPKRRELMGRYAQALQRRKRGRVGSPSPETSRRT
ncbi:hypothetical protein QR680_010930 [Steinernema hermaphroditum]|uniref:Uncharacterized protein n=1 Tax=Steinernema hermaphroditum TaxID=289476 RepID=A0AA39IQK4_9BILA|nr:hypothetical protein QR680_010930 [Steinernema hermaphroditum]